MEKKKKASRVGQSDWQRAKCHLLCRKLSRSEATKQAVRGTVTTRDSQGEVNARQCYDGYRTDPSGQVDQSEITFSWCWRHVMHTRVKDGLSK